MYIIMQSLTLEVLNSQLVNDLFKTEQASKCKVKHTCKLCTL